jgi:hypothetical protein
VQSYSKKSSAQEMKCKERENSLLISLGADKIVIIHMSMIKTDVKVNKQNKKRHLTNRLKNTG